ncbi:MAG: hypothetical protein QXO94_02155 [Candidatus Bathyarchaeia archaeon]
MGYRERCLTCPKCGFEFDILYARAMSCQSCPKLIDEIYCHLVRCPRCDYEFPINQRVTNALKRLQSFRPRV